MKVGEEELIYGRFLKFGRFYVPGNLTEVANITETIKCAPEPMMECFVGYILTRAGFDFVGLQGGNRSDEGGVWRISEELPSTCKEDDWINFFKKRVKDRFVKSHGTEVKGSPLLALTWDMEFSNPKGEKLRVTLIGQFFIESMVVSGYDLPPDFRVRSIKRESALGAALVAYLEAAPKLGKLSSERLERLKKWTKELLMRLILKYEEAQQTYTSQMFIINPITHFLGEEISSWKTRPQYARYLSSLKEGMRVHYDENALLQPNQFLVQVWPNEQERREVIESWIGVREGITREILDASPLLQLAEREENPNKMVSNLIKQEEGKYLEFKSTLRYDLDNPETPTDAVEARVAKTICGFLNQPGGGRLLIGVGDNGEIIGLQHDYKTLTSQDGGRDSFQRQLRQVVSSRLNERYNRALRVEFFEIKGKDVCLVHVKKAGEGVWMKVKGQPKLFIRSGNRTIPKDGPDAVNYIRENLKPW